MRRRGVESSAGHDELILPLDLTDTPSGGLPASDFAAFLRDQRAWLLDHGVDTADYRRVLAILRASKSHHAIPGALERHRLRCLAASQSADQRG